MKKNNASDYYYFSKKYFQETMNSLRGNIFLMHAFYNDKIIGSAMFMHYNEFLHYHFSATHPDYYKLASNNLILSEAAQWGKANNKKLMHLGGGYTTEEDDSLLFFKKSFVKNGMHDFWVGRRIHDANIYQELANMILLKNPQLKDSSFFPLYRAK
jgi:lipid II:glycine glycyltransferase (peptidoglycan interpeptide bridge formation enzyme)